MRRFTSLSCSLALILLNACASAGSGVRVSPSIRDSLSTIARFTVIDLQNADEIALAQAPPDAIAHTCFIALEAFVQNQQATVNDASVHTVSGAFSAFESGRASLRNAEDIISRPQREGLEVGCAPLILDRQNDMAGFLASLIALGVKP